MEKRSVKKFVPKGKFLKEEEAGVKKKVTLKRQANKEPGSNNSEASTITTLQSPVTARILKKTRNANKEKSQFISDFLEGGISIESLNALIEQLYPGDDEGDVDPITELDAEFEMPNAIRMFSSGTNYDCLSHSFLTVTCQAFRYLKQSTKNTFASYFRRTLVPFLISKNDTYLFGALGREESLEDIKRYFISKKFLRDNDADLLAHIFNIKILLLQPARTVYPNDQDYIRESNFNENTAEPVLTPYSKFMLGREGNVSDPFIIYGSGRHYEGVMFIDGTWQRDFLTVENNIRAFMAARSPGQRECVFIVPDKVLYNGSPHWVVGRKGTDKGCLTYTITNNEALVAELQKIGKVRNIKDEEILGFGDSVIKVPAEEVSMFSGGYNKRKTRKFYRR